MIDVVHEINSVQLSTGVELPYVEQGDESVCHTTGHA